MEKKVLAHLLVTVEEDGKLVRVTELWQINCESGEPVYFNPKTTEDSSLENWKQQFWHTSWLPLKRTANFMTWTDQRHCVWQCSAVADGYLNCDSGQPVYFNLKNTEGSSKNGNKSFGTPLGYCGTGRQTS